MEKTKIWDVYGYVTGIKPRDRKVKNHMVKLERVADTGGEYEFKPEVIEKLKGIVAKDFKNVTRIRCIARPMELDDRMESFMMFDPREQTTEVTL